jgi:hypothetical protein
MKKLLFSMAITLIASVVLNAQQLNSTGVNAKNIETYIEIAETLQSGKQPNDATWNSLFATYYFDFVINKFKMATADEIKKDILKVYTPNTVLTDGEKTALKRHLEYKENLNSLKKYIATVKDGSIRKNIQQYLYPFLPKRLQVATEIPTIIYTYFHADEANGLDTLILQDALLSMKADNFSRGRLTAHEAFHSIVNKAMQQKLTISLEAQTNQGLIIGLLSSIAQEGIADLIDKEVLAQKESPLYDKLNAMMQDETNKSNNYIKNLDEALVSFGKKNKIKNAKKIASKVIGFSGHLPGRMMGKIIRDADLLTEVITDIENPFVFIYAYNKAAEKLKLPNAVFSNEAILVLKKLEQELIKK